ncbi:MAG: hypothetical protein R3E52_14255 [Burkholderiaceae bacterium]
MDDPDLLVPAGDARTLADVLQKLAGDEYACAKPGNAMLNASR